MNIESLTLINCDMAIPTSAKIVEKFYYERYDLRINVWQTKSSWIFDIKVCPEMIQTTVRKNGNLDYHCLDKYVINAIRDIVHKYLFIPTLADVELNKLLEQWRKKD